ncbi:NAD(P)/FAD-dependent oxidoreductase [Bacteriovorax sp. Seq25_V]|uniref:NAD(P)/FAD-dependent oxidoreductase n=1 Tax=Bacteriovorax sp. Seq25_V TaxID=1201288 RepID=UPI000389ED98|nr:NAD(P)/FAD-dependent oxidoreductase [Bacteriovorax sp. Seq25_V]EQC46669.1 geranylgeranyl reductase family [Bacteriovorax sp. Seq25_V]
MDKIFDVLIVGAGPAGTLLASQLSNAGHSVVILEGGREVKRKVCGEYLCPTGVDLLRELGLSDIVDRFLPIKGMNIYSPNGLEVKSLFPRTGKDNIGVSLNRKDFDTSLVELAQASGAKIFFDQAVINFENQGSYWSVKTVQGEVFQARLLVGADGRRSHIARTIGATIPPVEDEKRIAIHAWVQRNTNHERVGQMHLFKDSSYIGLDPITENEINISLVCDPKRIKELGGPLAVINHYIEKSSSLHHQIGHVQEGEKIYTVSPISHQLKPYRVNNLVLIGDAAGFIDPLTGEGIFNALWMAKTLASEIIESQAFLDYNTAIQKFNSKRVKFFRQKKITNFFFQWLIRKKLLVELVAKFLRKSKKRADAFVGIIGNVYSPIRGLLKIIF